MFLLSKKPKKNAYTYQKCGTINIKGYPNFLQGGYKMKIKKQKGFTLVELITVIFIFSVIITIMIPNMRRAFYRARLTGCQSNLRNIATAVQSYMVDTKRYPSSLADLKPNYINAIPTCPAAGKDTYTDGYEVNTSPDQFTIHCSGENHTFLGYGKDEPRYSSKVGLGP